MTRDTTDKITAGGLRFTSKRPGSLFGGLHTNTRSCIYCGAHRGPSQRRQVKLGTRNETACEPACDRSPVKLK